MPIIEIVLRQLAGAGFDRVIITTGHLAGESGSSAAMVRGGACATGIPTKRSRSEPRARSSLVADRLEENFVLMNGIYSPR